MKKVRYAVVACSAFFCFLFLFGASKAQATIVGGGSNAIVTFGTQPPGGGVCIGDGICVALPPDTTKLVEGVPTTFSLDPLDATTLLITFSLSALNAIQPEQAVKMNNCANPPAGGITPTYQFGAPYNLSQPMFAAVGFPPNSSIQPSSIITITISGDVVTMHVKYAHS